MTQKMILIVDDDPDLRAGLQVRLNANHYDVALAADGAASIVEAHKHKPDLILLDLGLPAGDGFSVLERLHVNESLSSIPVVVVSGRDRVGNRERALKAGAKAYMQKPMSNEKLMELIRVILDEKGHPAVAGYD